MDIELKPIEQMERAQIDQQIATAKRFPRDLNKVKNEMLAMATMDDETAASCFYSLTKGNKEIKGESVRMAEIAEYCFGNLKSGTRIMDVVTGGDHPHVIVQAVAIDLEKNSCVSIDRWAPIYAKKDLEGKRLPISPDDIKLVVSACSSIAWREAIFKVIPKSLIKPISDAARRLAVGDASSLKSKCQKIIDRLNVMGIDTDRVFAVINVKSINEIDEDKLALLIGLGTAIKDGETTMEAAFPVIGPKVAAPKFTGNKRPKTDSPKEPEIKPITDLEKLVLTIQEKGIDPVKLDNALHSMGVISTAESVNSVSNDKAAEILGSLDEVISNIKE